MNKMFFFCLIWHVFKLKLPCILGIRNVFSFFLFFLIFLCTYSVRSATEENGKIDSLYCENSNIEDEKQLKLISQEISRPNPILLFIKEKRKKNKRITAAILAFPLPFGIVGLHRIYLGTSPYVPVVYIASLGGIFGILPFIDFCLLMLDKEVDRYIENKKVFMWVN